MYRKIALFGCLLCVCLGGMAEEGKKSEGFVSVKLNGQLGNQLFEIATAYAYALDQGLTLTVPDLLSKTNDNVPRNAHELFLSNIPAYEIPIPHQKWKEPNFSYTKIPAYESVELKGFFQSEKYFKHHRDEICELFAPSEGMEERILAKYPFLLEGKHTVGVQIRDYRTAQMYGKKHPTIGRLYYEKAFALFPKDTLFLVSSNNNAFARECTEGLSSLIIYLPGDDDIEELYTLAMCESFIISNSTFGWWAAWLSKSPDKKVTVPDPWFTLPCDNEAMVQDLIPESWTVIDSRKEKKLK